MSLLLTQSLERGAASGERETGFGVRVCVSAGLLAARLPWRGGLLPMRRKSGYPSPP